MSPFVTCHRGTGGAAGAPWGAFLGASRSECARSCQSSSQVPPSLGPAVPVSPASCLGQSDLPVTHLDGGLALRSGSRVSPRKGSGVWGVHLGIQVPNWGGLERDGPSELHLTLSVCEEEWDPGRWEAKGFPCLVRRKLVKVKALILLSVI